MKETQEELTYHVPVLLKESVDGMNIWPEWHVCRRDFRWWRAFP